jgi:LemA protein
VSLRVRWLRPLLLGLAGLFLAGCGTAELEKQEEAVKLAWAEAVHEYQRRADLVPDLLARLQGIGAEPGWLEATTQARARATAIPLTARLLNDAAAFERARAAQAELGTALEHLLAAAHGQPDLASDQSYRDLRAQLRDSEQRIARAHARYVEAATLYNASVRKFPTNITAGLFDFDVKPALERQPDSSN